MTKNKRTGLMPGKKFFTPVGGVGAKNIAIQNRVRSQASVPKPPPPPKKEETIKLFNTLSFSRRFLVNGNGSIDNEGTGLDLKYQIALTIAAKRWEVFLQFTPEMIKEIKDEYKKMYILNKNSDWNGIELMNYKFISDNAYASIQSSTGTIIGTSLKYGFGLSVNKNLMDPLTDEQKSHVLAHELGHVLGITGAFGGVFNNGVELFPKIQSPALFNPRYSYLHKDTFFKVWGEYNTYIADRNIRLTGVSVDPYVPLSDDLKHWRRDVIQRIPINQSNPTTTYPPIYNELMGNGYNPEVDNTLKYLISKMSISFLTELYSIRNGVKVYNYTEVKPGTSEVTRYIKTQTNEIILSGNPGFAKNLSFIENEIYVSEQSDELVINELISQLDNIELPEQIQMQDPEVTRILLLFERIKNDPSISQNTIYCGN